MLFKKYMKKWEEIEAQQAAKAAEEAAKKAAEAAAPRRRPRAASRSERAAAMRFDVLTLFPEIFRATSRQSLLKLAIQTGLVADPPVEHPRLGAGQAPEVDDRPFGGGPGMVLMAEPVFDCVEAVQAKAEPSRACW